MHDFRGPQLSQQDLEKVNEERLGECYTGYAAEAAWITQDSSHKKALTEMPFIRIIYYGAAKDSYWNASHVLVQVEDRMDMWNALTQTSYLLPLWEFDHSSGHDSEPIWAHYQRRLS
jgi:hypothetical protein